jgi:hypothetical protein
MIPEDRPISEINSHIEEYLDYYCGLSHAPGFAVLLKGEWGCGKTWFINKYRRKLEQQYKGSNLNKNNSKLFGKFLFTNFAQSNNYNQNTYKTSLYVSLNGKTNFAQIESELLLQLFFPGNLSKELKIAGSFTTELIKSQLKFNSSPLLKNLTEYFDKGNKKIIIFDDLERCPIALNEILGYINDYIEHQDSKIIILANEDKLLEISHYKDIKEKLIGKTFDINRDLDAALKSFIREISNADIENFLLNNTKLIEDIYLKSEYDNLRSLKQIILDFERLFKQLPDKAKSKPELLQEILQTIMAFSIEIRRGEMLPEQISELESEYTSGLTMQARRNVMARKQTDILNKEINLETQEPSKLQKIIDRYKFLNFLIYQPLPSLSWWQDFFDLGKIKEDELEQSILNSKYFADENTPNWIRLWHFYDTDIDDDEFHKLLEKVEAEYTDRKFIEIGEILHVTGIFLNLCNSGLYPNKTKQDILHDAQDYIDYLVKEEKLDLDLTHNSNATQLYSFTGYKRLGYQGIELEQFKVFKSYVEEKQQYALEQKLPQLGFELLDIMERDKWQFHRMLCINNFSDYQKWDRIYYKIPILKYIKHQDFINRFLSMNFDYQSSCLWTFTERYKAINVNPELKEELEWLKNIQGLLINEINNNQGELSGYRLKLLNEEYLNKAIEKLSSNE